jgi:hypothetical protein
MRITPLLVARPPKAKAVDVTCAPGDVPADPALPAGTFRPVVAGPIAHRRAALEQMVAEGLLVLDKAPGMLVCRVVCEGSRWVGLVCAIDTHEVLELAALQEVAARPAQHEGNAVTADDELAVLGWQVEPAVIRCRMPDGVGDLYLGDTNDRPAYHFVAAGGVTHSAWIVRDPSAYIQLMASAEPAAVLRGASRLMAAHRARIPALAILTRDFADDCSLPHALAPRCGLVVAPV